MIFVETRRHVTGVVFLEFFSLPRASWYIRLGRGYKFGRLEMAAIHAKLFAAVLGLISTEGTVGNRCIMSRRVLYVAAVVCRDVMCSWRVSGKDTYERHGVHT